MQYINKVAFAPQALKLYLNYNQKTILTNDWVTLDDFLESKSISLQSYDKGRLRAFLRSKLKHKLANPLHRKGKHAIFNTAQVEALYKSHPERFKVS